MEYSEIFLIQIAAAFFDRTLPASNIANPAAINMTKKPHTRKRKVLNTYCVSALTSAWAIPAINAKIPKKIKN